MIENNDDNEEPSIESLREKIDIIDTRIVEALNLRAEIVSDIQRIKDKEGIYSYDPKREEDIIDKVTSNCSPLIHPSNMKIIYNEILIVMKEVMRDTI